MEIWHSARPRFKEGGTHEEIQFTQGTSGRFFRH
jgi:hypothetical protein